MPRQENLLRRFNATEVASIERFAFEKEIELIDKESIHELKKLAEKEMTVQGAYVRILLKNYR